jgi:polygalacturonase
MEPFVSQAFEDAWQVACKVAASTLLVPSGSTFLVGPVSFLGKECKEKIVFQVIYSRTKKC